MPKRKPMLSSFSTPTRRRKRYRIARKLHSLIYTGITFFWCLVIIVPLTITTWFLSSGYADRVKLQLQDKIVNWSHHAGLVLEHVYMEGQDHTKDQELIESLNVHIGQPLLSIPLPAIKARLEKLDWVQHAIIEREFPTALHIRIIEYTPFALWQNGGQLYLINREGTIIFEDNLTPFHDLLLLVGSDAPLHIISLLDILDVEPGLLTHIRSAIRIGERRWNIGLNNGTTIKLPSESPEDAWKHIVKLYQEDALLSLPVKSIDLRIPGKLYMDRAKLSQNGY